MSLGLADLGPYPVEQNSIGLTLWAQGEEHLIREVFKRNGVAFQEAPIPHLTGAGGCASLVFYTSPTSGKPVTVLVIPQPFSDAYIEEYYYFEGLGREDAMLDEQAWLDRYTAAKSIKVNRPR